MAIRNDTRMWRGEWKRMAAIARRQSPFAHSSTPLPFTTQGVTNDNRIRQRETEDSKQQ
jgi:hypothetical protein